MVSGGHRRRMAVHWGGIAAIVVFYVMILLVGLWAARKSKSSEADPDSEDVMLAGRNIGLVVGIFTMTGKNETFKLITCTCTFSMYNYINRGLNVRNLAAQ